MSTPRGRHRGFTLIELMIVLGVLATLLGLALPSLAGFRARHRLAAASQSLVEALQQARNDAVQRAATRHVSWRTGADWCWAVSAAPGCDCAPAGTPLPACALHNGDGSDFGGVTLSQAHDVVFDARLGNATPVVAAELTAEASAPQRFATRLQVQASCRARACAAASPLPGLADCLQR